MRAGLDRLTLPLSSCFPRYVAAITAANASKADVAAIMVANASKPMSP
jgi:hypothetical protein